MLKNFFRSLGFYFMISVIAYAVGAVLFDFFDTHHWTKWAVIPESVIFLFVVYSFYYVGKYRLDRLKNRALTALSLSLIPLIGLLIAIADFLYRYHGHFDIDPYVIFNEGYTLPLFSLTGDIIYTQKPLWAGFLLVWGFSLFPAIMMFLGLVESVKK